MERQNTFQRIWFMQEIVIYLLVGTVMERQLFRHIKFTKTKKKQLNVVELENIRINCANIN